MEREAEGRQKEWMNKNDGSCEDWRNSVMLQEKCRLRHKGRDGRDGGGGRRGREMGGGRKRERGGRRQIPMLLQANCGRRGRERETRKMDGERERRGKEGGSGSRRRGGGREREK